MSKAREYYKLTKPGIIRGNLLTAAGGFFLASKGHIDPWLLLSTLVGTSIVIASACVFNNVLDRKIDVAMERTKDRALVSGVISVGSAMLFAAVLGILGIVILAEFTNILTVGIGLIGFVSYVFIYGYAKRKSVHGTLIGTISGATPIVAGYCAVTNRFDLGAVLLFLILVFWQMAHFFGIAMYRHDDYAAAKIPVLPVVKGMYRAKIQTILYAVGFIISTLLLSIFRYTGITFAIVMTLVGGYWVFLGAKNWRTLENDSKWGKKMFLFSLIVIFTLSLMLSAESFLP